MKETSRRFRPESRDVLVEFVDDFGVQSSIHIALTRDRCHACGGQFETGVDGTVDVDKIVADFIASHSAEQVTLKAAAAKIVTVKKLP